MSDSNLIQLSASSALEMLNLTLTNVSDKALNQFAKRKEPSIHTIMLGRCQLLSNKSIVNLLQYQPVEIIELWEVPRLTDELLYFIEAHDLTLRQIGLERCDQISEEAAGRLATQKPHIRISVNKSSHVINELQRNLEIRSRALVDSPSSATLDKPVPPDTLVRAGSAPARLVAVAKPPSLATVTLRKTNSPLLKKL